CGVVAWFGVFDRPSSVGIRAPGTSTLLPYTTLFRSRCGEKQHSWDDLDCTSTCARCSLDLHTCTNCQHFDTSVHWQCRLAEQLRSEEHTSELQSRENLVCRLLLEKKKLRKPRLVCGP